ncbi:VC0807 family protein [Rariglobus hedericola]|uniref:MFS transporter n=1 Tax=Rariglobus hedericola TaxID=2597822 RepID=A0A556QKU4_9BACT|nr:VC0807 family protein [Rariglobus hedericola]TSJ77275.1 MFS transporter [Rariglobus hedericola]
MATPAPKKENLLLNLVFNILIPTLVLSKLSKDTLLGPVVGLVVALAFPLGYGVWDFLERKKANFISIIGFVSVLLTGGLALMHIGGMGFAIKEAAVPTVIGIAVLLSLKTKTPLVRTMLYNEQVIDVERVDTALNLKGNRKDFDRLLFNASCLLSLSFLVSAALNFGLARYLLKSPAGTAEFNAELGKMHFLSWPVIVIPSMAMMMFALWRLLSGIKKLTGLELDAIFKTPPEKPKTKKA